MKESRTANEAKQFVHSKLLELRNLFTTINSEKFIDAYELADDYQKKQLWCFLVSGNHIAILKWQRRLLRAELGSLSMKELRKIGQEYGIHNYNSLPKICLLSAIRNKEALDDRNLRGNDLSSITSKNTVGTITKA